MIFEVPGKPTGKARARTFYNPKIGRVQSITPKDTVSYENLVKMCYITSEHRREWFNKEPITMYITAFFEIPKSTSKKDRARMLSGELHPTKKPDADNIAKIVCDALNDVAYHDDTQIVRLIVDKRYTESAPRVTIGIYDYRCEENDARE